MSSFQNFGVRIDDRRVVGDGGLRLLGLIRAIDEALLLGHANRHDVVVGAGEARDVRGGDHGRQRRQQRAADNLAGLQRGRLFRQAVPAFGHQGVETLHQLLDLPLVLLQGLVGHFLLAAGHLLLNPPLLAESKLLPAPLDVAVRGTEHPQQAVAHFRTEFADERQIAGLLPDHARGLARIDRDLAAGLVDRVLHVLLPLLFQGGAPADFLGRGSAVGRGNPAVAARRFRSPGPPPTGRFVTRLGSRARRAPLAFLAMASLIARASRSLGLRRRAVLGQLIGVIQVAAFEGRTGQVGQPAAASFDLLFGRGQTCAIDQRQSPAAVGLGLVDQRNQVTVAGVRLQLGNVPGQLFGAGGTVNLDLHVLGCGRFRRADQHRVAVAAERRKAPGINVHAGRPFHVLSGLGPEDRPVYRPGQAGAIGTGIHAGLFGNEDAPGAGGQDSQQFFLDLGTDAQGDHRRPLGHQIVDDAVELIGRKDVGPAAAIADIDDSPRRLAVPAQNF